MHLESCQDLETLPKEVFVEHCGDPVARMALQSKLLQSHLTF